MYDDDMDTLAAEYVLGTLSADERAHAEALLAIDSGFVEVVRQWERRLGELNVMVEAVDPPPEVWDKIKADIARVAPGEDVGLAPLEPLQPAKETPAQPEVPSPVAALASVLLPPEAETEGRSKDELRNEAEAAEHEADAEATSPAESSREFLVPPVAPKIERSPEVIYLAGSLRRWRRWALVTTALAVVLAVYVALSQFAPGLMPPGLRAFPRLVAQPPAPARPQGNRLVAVLQQDPTSPAFLVTVDAPSRTLTVRRIAAAPEAGRSYELWLISPRLAAPRSLGIVGNDEFTQRPLPPGVDLDTIRSASYEVSFEPAGGSPSGVPSGPILFTGKPVEALPASQPNT